MGSPIEINDTLNITREQGFPSDVLNRERHSAQPVQLADVAGKVFPFSKPDARIYHLPPTRVYLVENIDNKWIFWGQALMQSQTISKQLEADGSWVEGNWVTSGTYSIIKLYDPEYQKIFTLNESPAGKCYFEPCLSL